MLEVTGGGRARDFEGVRDHAIIRVFTEGVRPAADRGPVGRPDGTAVRARGAAQGGACIQRRPGRPLHPGDREGRRRLPARAPDAQAGGPSGAVARQLHRGPMTGSGVYQMLNRRAGEAGSGSAATSTDAGPTESYWRGRGSSNDYSRSGITVRPTAACTRRTCSAGNVSRNLGDLWPTLGSVNFACKDPWFPAGPLALQTQAVSCAPCQPESGC
jgi:hypothetical protein